MLDHFQRLLAAYQPRPYSGHALVFHSPGQPGRRCLDVSLGWAELCTGPFACENVPGDHLGLFQDPGASQMAGHINALLRGAARVTDEVRNG
jgi:thioesterase domain-containing protein